MLSSGTRRIEVSRPPRSPPSAKRVHSHAYDAQACITARQRKAKSKRHRRAPRQRAPFPDRGRGWGMQGPNMPRPVSPTTVLRAGVPRGSRVVGDNSAAARHSPEESPAARLCRPARTRSGAPRRSSRSRRLPLPPRKDSAGDCRLPGSESCDKSATGEPFKFPASRRNPVLAASAARTSPPGGQGRDAGGVSMHKLYSPWQRWPLRLSPGRRDIQHRAFDGHVPVLLPALAAPPRPTSRPTSSSRAHSGCAGLGLWPANRQRHLPPQPAAGAPGGLALGRRVGLHSAGWADSS